MVDLTRIAESLKREEGFIGHVYYDSVGIATIGYGRMIDERRGGKITKREAEVLLNNDILESMKNLDWNVRWWHDLPADRMEAMVEMCFQLGWPKLSGFKKMLAALEAGDGQKAYDEALDSRWAAQTPGRALRVASMFLKREPTEGR